MGVRVYTFIMIMVGIQVMLFVGGIETGPHILLEQAGVLEGSTIASNIATSSLYTRLTTIFGGLALAGIIAGLFSRTIPTYVLVASFAIFLLTFIIDVASVVAYSSANYGNTFYVTNVLWIIVTGISIGYVFSVIEWWRSAGD